MASAGHPFLVKKMAEITLTSFADAHDAFCNPALRQSLYDAGDVIMKDVLLTLHGEAHKKRRHLELRLFRRNYAHFYEQQIFPATMAATLAPFIRAGEADLVELGFRVTMNLTADFAGVDRPAGSINETEQLLAIVKTFSEGATLVHSDRDRATVVAEVTDAMNVFREMFLKPSWARRLELISQFASGQIGEEDLPRDVLTVLLRNQDNIELPDDVIEREIGFYLQAGSHSTANSVVDAVHELIMWSSEPLTEIAKDPLLLQRCVHESMRLHPASPVAWRTPVAPTVLANGIEASTDDLVIIDLEQANRDPSVFGADAGSFNPHREILRNKTQPYGLTFGTGVHMCTGRDLDGGLAAQDLANPEDHQYGIVSQLVRSLLQAGLSPHPDKVPTQDSQTTRTHWGYYPVVFQRHRAMTLRNLIITGGINHDFDDTTDALSEVLEGVGFESSIYNDIDAAFDAMNEERYDLITMNTLRWRMLDDDKYIPDRKMWAYEIGQRDRLNLSAHLRGGGGLLGLHTAAICFDTWDEWPVLLGAKWIWGKTFHPPPKTIHVSNINQRHPSTKRLGKFDVVDEIYHYIQPGPNAEPLFSTISPDDGSEQTLAWAHQVGSGRAIYNSLGHDRASVSANGHAQFLQDAALWCCGA